MLFLNTNANVGLQGPLLVAAAATPLCSGDHVVSQRSLHFYVQCLSLSYEAVQSVTGFVMSWRSYSEQFHSKIGSKD